MAQRALGKFSSDSLYRGFDAKNFSHDHESRWTDRLTKPFTHCAPQPSSQASAVEENSESPLEHIIRLRATILIFLATANEFRRFVVSGAIQNLAAKHDLHYVVPSAELPAMREVLPGILVEPNTSVLDVPSERLAVWTELSQAARPSYRDTVSALVGRPCGEIYNRGEQLRKLPKWILVLLKIAMIAVGRVSFLPKRVRMAAEGLAALLRIFNWDQQPFGFKESKEHDALVQQKLNSLGPLPAISEIFDRVNPLYTVLPSSLWDNYYNDVIWSCEVEEIACLVLQSEWNSFLRPKALYHTPTMVGCWGKQSRTQAASIQLPPSIVHQLGHPQYKQLFTSSRVVRSGESARSPEAVRVVVFRGSIDPITDLSVLEHLERIIESGRLGSVKILVVPYHSGAIDGIFHRRKWSHVLNADGEFFHISTEGQSTLSAPCFDRTKLTWKLSPVDAVISSMSPFLFDALILHRPTLVLAFGEGAKSQATNVLSRAHFKKMRRSGAVVWCDDQSTLERAFGTLLSTEWRLSCGATIGRYVAKLIAADSQAYAVRLSDLARDRLEPSARKLRAYRTARRRVSISNAYGANLIARNYTGGEISDPLVPGYWMHGWIPKYHNVDPALIAMHKRPGQEDSHDYQSQIIHEKLVLPQWVSRDDQAQYLKMNGYRHVAAIGLPIVYIPSQDVPRIEGSLLVMPPHSHSSHGSDDPVAEQYADEIYELKKDFEHIRVCLHEDDIAKEQWIKSFQRRGIKVFPSADQADPLTLVRLKRILSTFEYVTTNGFGSHIAYAAYCGAKVSIFGRFAEFPKKKILGTHAVKVSPHLADTAHWLCTEEALRQNFSFLFVHPADAEQIESWGAEQVGDPFRVSPAKLSELFEWPLLSEER